MRFARRSRQEVDVNLTPLIDVVFLLLIFFMISTTFTRETHLSIDLPKAEFDNAPSLESAIEISISKRGDYAVNGVALLNNKASTLMAAFNEKGKGEKSAPVIITADSAAPHQSVVTALDIAGRLGFTKVRITTELTYPADESAR